MIPKFGLTCLKFRVGIMCLKYLPSDICYLIYNNVITLTFKDYITFYYAKFYKKHRDTQNLM